MDNSRGKILWIDDEINQLKPHILFLEERGYKVATSSSGVDALSLFDEYSYDLILLDHFMIGIDGIETLRRLKEKDPSVPIIMITKSEEEWLMDEAISEKISQFLIKPVNPSQIFMACKQILEKITIRNEKISKVYLDKFQEIESCIENANHFIDWWNLYNELTLWSLKFEEHNEESLIQILQDQFYNANRKFTKFIESQYLSIISSNDRPTISKDVFKNEVFSKIDSGEKVCFLIMDSMRLDQFYVLKNILSEDFMIDIKPSMSILPTATSFSRNSIFSGMFPDDFCKNYPAQLNDMQKSEGNLNNYEELFFNDQLKRFELFNKSHHYHKIWSLDEGIRFHKNIDRYKKCDIISIVVNFIDQLAYKRSHLEILKEMVPDESGYRNAILSWYEKSWLKNVINELRLSDFKIIMTSDHGSITVKKPAIVSADKLSSDGFRYKFGRNINIEDKFAIDARDLDRYHLPSLGHQCNYLIAKDDYFFVYPNEKNKYTSKLKNSFQHGGISMQEMLIPIFTMTSK